MFKLIILLAFAIPTLWLILRNCTKEYKSGLTVENLRDVTYSERFLGSMLWIIGIPTIFIGSLLMWRFQREKSDFINQQGKDFFNFWITYCVYTLILYFIFGEFISETSSIRVLAISIFFKTVVKIAGTYNAFKGKRTILPFTYKKFK